MADQTHHQYDIRQLTTRCVDAHEVLPKLTRFKIGPIKSMMLAAPSTIQPTSLFAYAHHDVATGVYRDCTWLASGSTLHAVGDHFDEISIDLGLACSKTSVQKCTH